MNAPQKALEKKPSREERRHRVLEATVETLARRGYAKLTLTDVAVTAGISHGSSTSISAPRSNSSMRPCSISRPSIARTGRWPWPKLPLRRRLNSTR